MLLKRSVDDSFLVWIASMPPTAGTAVEVPSTYNEVEEMPCTDRAVEVTCTDSRGADR